MQPKFSHLYSVENEHPILETTDRIFWERLQNGLLLALKEQGRLSGLQYQYARERLHLPSDEGPEGKK